MANDQAEKTEKATPRRRSKERNKGHIAKSQDFTSSFVLSLGIAILYIRGQNMLDKMSAMMSEAFSNLKPDNIVTDDIVAILGPYFHSYIDIVALFFVLLAICAIMILRFQTGALFAKEALKPNFKKLSPASAWKNLIQKFNPFKPKQMVEFAKSIIKLMVICMLGIKVITKHQGDFFGLLGADVSTGIVVVSKILMELLLNICLFLLFVGILDRKYQTYEYEKSIKMTKQEVKDERKNVDGDPKIKSKIRSFQMKIMQQKMMSNIKDADVVVVNPTHYAVALMYDPQKAPAPVVVAKGVDFVAFRIREVAKNNNIPIVENKPLARSLYKLVDINQIIPQELYVAVAEILQFVSTRR